MQERSFRRFQIRDYGQSGITVQRHYAACWMRILLGESCAEVRQMIAAKLADVDRRVKELRRLRRSLVKMDGKCRNRADFRSSPALWAMEK